MIDVTDERDTFSWPEEPDVTDYNLIQLERAVRGLERNTPHGESKALKLAVLKLQNILNGMKEPF